MWSKYSDKEINQEQEANYFACALLMPRDMFEKELERLKDHSEDDRISILGKTFEVPLPAVVMRMEMLTQIIKYEKKNNIFKP